MTIERDCFWFKTGTGYPIYYRKGEGVTVEREPRADPEEEQLWLNGSTYAALAAINGYLPVHASAVAWRGRAYAFAGPSGAGKSTLAAALGHHGLPLVCDDTMILDTASASQIICLPGHKRLKVKEDTLSLVDLKPQEKVAAMVSKYYAEPPGGTCQQALPLAKIFYLSKQSTLNVERIAGAQRIVCLNDSHYTAQLYALARGDEPAARLSHLGAIAQRIAMYRLGRPVDCSRFEDTTQAIAQRIKQSPAR